MARSEIKRKLNTFFVDCFNAILRQEERVLEKISNSKLSLKEIHLLEAIDKMAQKKENTAGGVAKNLKITLGSLTVAVNVLEKKGYLVKLRDEKDKRLIFLKLTDLGRYVNSCHELYHENMINEVLEIIDEKEQEILVASLEKLQNYFLNSH